jgi:hypothetical protein
LVKKIPSGAEEAAEKGVELSETQEEMGSG